MSNFGFGGHSGPTAPPRASPAFGQFSPPPPSAPPQQLQSPHQLPPFSRPAPVRSPPRPEGLGRPQSPLFFPQNNLSASRAPFSAPAAQRPNGTSAKAAEGQNPLYRDQVQQVNQMSPGITSLVATRTSSTSITANIAKSVDPKRSDFRVQPMQRDTTNNFAPRLRSPLSYEDIYDPKEPHTSPIEAQRNFAPRPRSPLSYEDIYDPKEPHTSPIEAQRPEHSSTSAPRAARSSPLAQRSNYSAQNVPHSGLAQRPASNSWSPHTKSQGEYSNSTAYQDFSPDPPYIKSSYSRRVPADVRPGVAISSKVKSPPLPSTIDSQPDNLQFRQLEPKRSVPPPLSSKRKPEILFSGPQPIIPQNAPSFSNVVPEARATNSNSFLAPKRTKPSSPLSSDQNFQTPQNSSPSFLSSAAEAPATKSSISSVPKRTRSPSSLSPNGELQMLSQSSHDETESEMQAKAKRMARFKVELIDSPQNDLGFLDAKISSKRRDPSIVEGGNFYGRASMELSEDHPYGDLVENNESLELSSIIVGLCPDMCPESERAERERKGDLDQYERVDGDRNQTTEFLAVKKYNRTAEREANLIRPMPVLQRTMEYLLSLLDQPYDDRFLGIYNFLWDRMRAVRMDLRMQHIFNLKSVKMLEQMIRLHIIAMHELCEYEKGEGFSEGFDAHLNIEQMNKASAELFQLYDDHRRKGIDVPTEKEFRGYYALLKLDRHPGYKVEPAELSLDLAKMTPEIRQSSEIRFARDVARSCRTGNFISFFRLARKASYLQACLMHAHFAKLRSQALASLHSGLQSNQGLPVSVVASWLAMEEEDIESVLHYHGFLIKEFKEPYLVKEGPFLNSDTDYDTKCSYLVHLKKSPRIVGDIISSRSIPSPRKKAPKIQLDRNFSLRSKTSPPAGKRSQMQENEKLDGSEANFSLKQSREEQLAFRSPAASREESGQTMASSGNLSWGFPVTPIPSKAPPMNFAGKFEPRDTSRNSLNLLMTPTTPKTTPFGFVGKISDKSRSSPDISIASSMEVILPPVVPAVSTQEILLGVFDSSPEKSPIGGESISQLENKEPTDTPRDIESELQMHQDTAPEEEILENEDKEVAEAKLKLILRAWKRRSSKRRERREQRQLVIADALNSLTLGPPIQRIKDHGVSFGDFDIDRISRERHEKHDKSWSRLNVADVAAATLKERNPEAKCLCWKVILFSSTHGPDSEMFANLTAMNWLHTKLMPNKDGDYDDEFFLSYPGLSIWKKWLAPKSRADSTCCLSVVKDINISHDPDNLDGANAIIFFLSEGTPLEHQKSRLHNLLNRLPPGSPLPLLILSGSFTKEAPSAIISSLGLHEIEPSRVGSCEVVFLTGDEQTEYLDGFFSDRQLREGLQWLASESQPQPTLLSLQTRGLVQSHLSPSIEALSRINAEPDPNRLIAAFNESLNQSLNKVVTAVSTISPGWPCPEITLLSEFSEERIFTEQYLPTIGWNSDSKVEPLLSALRECKLPNINIDDISWLNRGCYTGEEIERQKLLLENFLTRYLTDSTNIMGIALARNEASVMVQRNVRLELRDSAYFIIPMWESIFRRIFNWRLMNLSSDELSTCYVLEQDVVPLQPSDFSKPVNEEGTLLNHSLEFPSLDEMLQVARVLQSPMEFDEQPKLLLENGNKPISNEVQYTEDFVETDGYLSNGEMDSGVEIVDHAFSNASRSRSSGPAVLTEASEQTDKLSSLLQKCNVLQNVIDEKLSLYF